MRKAMVGLRPSFSAQVRLGEPGVPFPAPKEIGVSTVRVLESGAGSKSGLGF